MRPSFKLARLAQLSFLALLTWCSVLRAGAADYYVSMSFYEYNPSYLEIQVGDTVWWRNDDFFDIYSSVSTQGYWDTGDLYPGESSRRHLSNRREFPLPGLLLRNARA